MGAGGGMGHGGCEVSLRKRAVLCGTCKNQGGGDGERTAGGVGGKLGEQGAMEAPGESVSRREEWPPGSDAVQRSTTMRPEKCRLLVTRPLSQPQGGEPAWKRSKEEGERRNCKSGPFFGEVWLWRRGKKAGDKREKEFL